MSQSPVVVIGAGIGGLAAAVSLAADGVPVTLIERHATPGGKMRRVEVAGRQFDAGPTVFTMRWVFEALFARAGASLDERLALSASTLLARHGWVGSEPLDLFTDIERSCEAIRAFSGASDADAYRRFAARTETVFDTLDRSFMRAERNDPIALTRAVLAERGARGLVDLFATAPFASLWRELAKTFHDPRLVQLFARYATYCGSSPFRAPATLMLIAHVERCGVWQLDGGMHALALALDGLLDELGGTRMYGNGVARIDTASGRVRGILLDDGSRLETGTVVFNGDTQALVSGLLGDEVTGAATARRGASLSAVTRCDVATPRGFPLAHHTVFFGDDYADEFDAIFDRADMTPDPTVYVCAQDRHDDTAPTMAPERLFSLINAPARSLDEGEITAAGDRITATLSRHGLEQDEPIGQPVITPPNDFARLFPATDGALYGRPTHGPFGSFSRPGSRSHVAGLYLCGGSVHPGAGVPMAALSGQIVADRVRRDSAGKRVPFAQAGSSSA